jgi:dephospho-CoA kinase
MLTIGLTGPIGCGKTTVARWLAEQGAVVVDADDVARAVTAPDGPVHDAVLDHFGPTVRGPDGTLDRAALAARAFASPEALRELESIVHPAVRPRILAAIEAARTSQAPAVVVEAIKLVEGGLGDLCDEVWLVTCDPELQPGRLAARGIDDDDAGRRLDAQRGLVDRLRPAATRVIDTSGDLAATRATVLEAWDEVQSGSG